MKYRVRWTRTAENELTQLWMRSVDRREVNDAARQIDLKLGIDAPNQGESRAGIRRIILESPLAATFEVRGNEVFVLHVWRYRVG